MKNLATVFQNISIAVRHAGIVAKSFQGRVQNEGKQVEAVSQDESARQKALRSAKTLIDEVVQEILLTSVHETFDRGAVMLDAEEETPLTRFFATKDKDISVVIDPIDGTLEYLEGRDDYSICIGVLEKGIMKLAFVFFPVRGTAYVIASDGLSYICENFISAGMNEIEEIVLPQDFQKTIYKNSRVPEEILSRAHAAGYEVLDDQDDAIGAPQALLTILSGKSCAYISETRNMRDILLGAIIGNAKGGFANDGSGHDLLWPQKGRVPRAVFGNDMALEEVKAIFK